MRHSGRCLMWLILLWSSTGVSALESPHALLEMKMGTQLLTRTEGTMTGEGVCWHASWRAGDFVAGARETGDLAYVDAAVTYFDALIGKLHTSPDGYRGWVGPFIYDDSVIGDVHVGDAILVNHMLKLAEFVRSGDVPGEAGEGHDEAAQRYIDLAQHICEKWQARDTWWENAHYGGYITWGKFLSPGNLESFQERADVRTSGLGLQFNKQQSMGIVHLRLYRLTGDLEHRRKAQLIFNHARSRLALFEDHYTWNYWEPFYPADVVSVDPPELRLWVATHPYRNYQSGEVGEFVEAFHSGITFSAEDMRRFVRTNLRMWNGDFDEPRWVNSNAAASRAAIPDFEPLKPDGEHFDKVAGAQWHALDEFDETLARLAGKEVTNAAHARRYALPVSEFEWPVPEVTYLNMGCVLPATVSNGGRAYVVSKSRLAGDIRISLMDASGEREVAEIYSGATPGGLDGREGLLIREWTADVEPGVYRVRWTFGDEHRDYLITVAAGVW